MLWPQYYRELIFVLCQGMSYGEKTDVNQLLSGQTQRLIQRQLAEISDKHASVQQENKDLEEKVSTCQISTWKIDYGKVWTCKHGKVWACKHGKSMDMQT